MTLEFESSAMQVLMGLNVQVLASVTSLSHLIMEMEKVIMRPVPYCKNGCVVEMHVWDVDVVIEVAMHLSAGKRYVLAVPLHVGSVDLKV
jgi:hypothetical protein